MYDFKRAYAHTMRKITTKLGTYTLIFLLMNRSGWMIQLLPEGKLFFFLAMAILAAAFAWEIRRDYGQRDQTGLSETQNRTLFLVCLLSVLGILSTIIANFVFAFCANA